MRTARVASLAVALLLLQPLAASAKFPDVPSDYPHAAAIDKLVERGVIGGNPDGTFRPRNPVDRAAMLKMLYVAATLTPDASKTKCFPDVVAGSWYETYVCDAVARGYVKGYEDKTFKPARPVSRAEAIKLTIAVLGIPEADLSADVTMYADVGSSDWFRPFVRTALARKILPIPGQDGKEFGPQKLMERGEAAAYIWNALQGSASVSDAQSSAGTATSAAASSSSLTDREQDLKAQQQQEAELQARAQRNTTTLSYPFQDERSFDNKEPLSYRFTLSSSTVASIESAVGANEDGTLSCRLYRMEANGFSSEYYLGFVDAGRCSLRVALTKGDYQLQLQPTSANVRFSVSAKPTTGDGSDGFSEAKPLLYGKLRTELLGENDYEDWYMFDVANSTTVSDFGGKKMTLKIVSADKVSCIVYPLANVDLFGFSGPACNEEYLYPAGSYMVSIRHAKPYQAKQAYTVELK